MNNGEPNISYLVLTSLIFWPNYDDAELPGHLNLISRLVKNPDEAMIFGHSNMDMRLNEKVVEDLKVAIESSLDSLSEREAEVIRKTFGLAGNEIESFAEIAESLNKSEELIWQVLSKTMHKLRAYHPKVDLIHDRASRVFDVLVKNGIANKADLL